MSRSLGIVGCRVYNMHVKHSSSASNVRNLRMLTSFRHIQNDDVDLVADSKPFRKSRLVQFLNQIRFDIFDDFGSNIGS